VTNALIHNEVESPAVDITVSRTDERVHIDVTDNGPPIPEMERNVLLEGNDRTALYHGSGLGLWLVKLIVTRSGGTIDFEEATPRGNTIHITLPKTRTEGG
jgi:signal transduction histidine kinase